MENSFKLPAENIKKITSFFLVMICLNIIVFAQAEEEQEMTVGEEVQWQTLEWEDEGSAYVLHYDIEIEKYNAKKNVYEPMLSLKTEDNSTSVKIQPQLSSGKYRYRIISYDLLGFALEDAEWNELIIYKAFQPEIKDVSSNVNYSNTIYIEEYNDGIFNISGKNLFPMPEKGDELSYTTYWLRRKALKNKIFPIILENPDGKKLKIKLTDEQMDTGTYYFVAKDASGLESKLDSSSELIIKYKKMMDLNLSLGYSVPYMLYDDTIPVYMDSKIWPLSATPKITFVPVKRRWGFLGLGAMGSYTMMNADFENYKIDGSLISGFTNLVYQKPIYFRVSETQRKHIMTLEAHVGGGIVYFNNYVFSFSHDIKSEPLNSLNIAVDAGLALQYFITSRLYAEVDVTFINAFAKNTKFGMVVPTVSIGWQF